MIVVAIGVNATLSISTGNYSLAQSSTGETSINSATGQSLFFKINNVTAFRLASSSEVTFSDGTNLTFNTTTGTKIGTATTQKIGFFNATPVVQPGAVTTSQGIADALSSLGLLASSSISTTPDVGGKLYLFNSY